ncbi:Acg family FMN-binding oxidoreductase [Pilimelia columellifera]
MATTTLRYTRDDLLDAAPAAGRAPSMHNSQPWRFRLHDGAIDVLLDADRALPAADPHGWGARLACGAAALNLELALAIAGRPADLTLGPLPNDPSVLARLTPAARRPPTPTEQSLYAAIALRHSNRGALRPDPVPPAERLRLRQAAETEGCWLELVVGSVAVEAVAGIARVADRTLARDAAYMAELEQWRRFSHSPDGVPTDSAAVDPSGSMPQRPFGGPGQPEADNPSAEPLIAVLGSATDSPAEQVRAGIALQRVLLTATDARLAVSMVSQPIEVPSAREQLRLALRRFGVAQMVMRVGYGPPGWPTPRRDPAETVDAAVE